MLSRVILTALAATPLMLIGQAIGKYIWWRLVGINKPMIETMTRLDINPIRLAANNCTINPFHYDLYHMGQDFSKGTMIMYANHDNEPGEFMILVNKRTGDRMRIRFPEKWQ